MNLITSDCFTVIVVHMTNKEVNVLLKISIPISNKAQGH